MFRAQTGAAVQQGGGYTAAVRRAIAAGDRRAIQELAKPVNYGDAARTPDAQQAMALARRNLAPAGISTAPTVDTGVSEAAQISMPQNLPSASSFGLEDLADKFSPQVRRAFGNPLEVFGYPALEGAPGVKPPTVLDIGPAILNLSRGPGGDTSATPRAVGMSVSDTDVPAAAPGTVNMGDKISGVFRNIFPAKPQPGVLNDQNTPAIVANLQDTIPENITLPRTNFETQTGMAPQVPMLMADRVAAGLAFDMNNPFKPAEAETETVTKPKTDTQEAVSEETGSSATSETQAAAESDSKKAAGEAGATTIDFGDPFQALNTATAGTAGQSDQEKTLRESLDLLTQSREGLSTASADRVAMAQSRVGDAAAKLNDALSKDPKRAKEITLSEVRDEALKLTGFDEEKYSKGRGDAFWMGLMRAGLAIAGGESENAITNIAKGLGIGLEGYGRDLSVLTEQEREDRKELRNTQLLLVKNKQDLENAWVAQENAYQDRLIQLRAAQEQGAQANLIAAQTADAQLQLSISQLDVTSAKAISDAERADKKIDADNAFRVWSTKLNALPTEVKQTVFLGPEFGSIGDDGNISFTEEGEKFYKELILASTKKSVKPTDLIATVNAHVSAGKLGGYALPEDQSIARAAAFAWERDDIASEAAKARDAAISAEMNPKNKTAAGDAAFKKVIETWRSTYDLKPVGGVTVIR